jgi:quercetin dioxygenase-like cupin family protein
MSEPFILHGDECVNGTPYHMIGNVLRTKLVVSDAAGSATVMVNTVTPHNGPPLHQHPFEESFYILDGAFVFEIDGAAHAVAPGDFVHVPAGVPHVFQNTTESDARYLLVIRPAGIERYFEECAEHAISDPGDTAAMNALGEKYGIQTLGPPMAARGNRAIPRK